MTTMEQQVEDEQAEHEAEEEAEESAFEAPEQPEEPEEPEQPEALTPVGPDEIRKAERAIEAQRKKLAGILGEDYVAAQCVLCTGLGFMPELPPLGTEFTLVPGEDGAELEFRAPREEPPYEKAPDKDECPECAGYGMVLTGAKAEHGRVAPCSKCAGNGWVLVARDMPTPEPAYFPALPPTPSENAAAVGLANDAWGRAAGHPHWGVPPASIPG